MTSVQRARPLKERLNRYGEKLSGISGSIRIDKRRCSGLMGSTQRRKLGSHDFTPGQLLLARRQFRHSIGCGIFVVELVSKFVKHNVLAVGRISGARFSGLPGKNQRTHSAAGLAKTGHGALFPNVLLNLPFLFYHICGWINENGEQTREIVCLAMQQQKTSLRRDGHADLISDRETATSLETFFSKKDLDVAEKFCPVACG